MCPRGIGKCHLFGCIINLCVKLTQRFKEKNCVNSEMISLWRPNLTERIKTEEENRGKSEKNDTKSSA